MAGSKTVRSKLYDALSALVVLAALIGAYLPSIGPAWGEDAGTEEQPADPSALENILPQAAGPLLSNQVNITLKAVTAAGTEVSSLMPQDRYECGQEILFRTYLDVSGSAPAGPHVLELNWAFDQQPNSGWGVGYRDLIGGTATIDEGAHIVSTGDTWPSDFAQEGTVRVTAGGIQPGKTYQLGFKVLLGCNPPYKLSGNLHATYDGGLSNPGTPNESSMGAGKQSIPMAMNAFDASLTIEKTVSGTTSTQAFPFTAALQGGSVFSSFDLRHAETKPFTGTDALFPGTYVVDEAIPSGWQLSDLTCTGTSTFTRDLAAGTVTVTLLADDDVLCTFTNTQQPGSITIEKVTVPAGASESFTFTPTGTSPTTTFQLSDTQTKLYGNLAPGTYTFTETVPAGWALTERSCTSSGTTITGGVSVTLAAGGNVTCTFTNTKLARASVAKVTVPASNESGWEFALQESDGEGGWDAVDTATTAGTSPVLFDGHLEAGSYRVVETAKSGWNLTGVELDGSAQAGPACSFTVAYPAAAGKTFACEFTNTQQSTVTVVKRQDGGVPTMAFSFRLTGPNETNLTRTTTPENQGTLDFGALRPGTYELCELSLPSGWSSTLGTPDPTTRNICIQVVLTAGQAYTVTVNNTPPPPPSPNPAMTMEKQVSVAGGTWLDADTAPGPMVRAGDDVRFRFIITNTGGTTLTGLVVTDDTYSTTGCAPALPASLAPGASASCVIGPFAATAGQHTNIGTASAGSLTASDPANYFGAAPSISVIKVAELEPDDEGILNVDFDPDNGVDETITYEYTITNTGNVTLTAVDLVDDILGTILDDLDEVTLEPGESITVTAVHVVTAEDADAGSVRNTGLATGTPPVGPDVSDSDDETVFVTEVLPLIIEPEPEPEPAPEPVLPATGADSTRMLQWSLILMSLGAAMVALRPATEASRRHRRRD